eukprot:6990146-Ditylum_brightwellii.AAC.2
MLSSEQNASGYEANPVVQNVNLETTGPSPSQESTAEPAISSLQQSQVVERYLRHSNLSALNRRSRETCRGNRSSNKSRRRQTKSTRHNNSIISSAIRASATAHDAYAGMPQLKEREYSSDGEDYISFSDSDDTNYNSKIPAQHARNEKKNLIEIGNGSGNFDGDDDNICF